MSEQIIDARALVHMRQALAAGWHTRDTMTDYTQVALEAEGYEAIRALNAADNCYRKNFAIYQAN